MIISLTSPQNITSIDLGVSSPKLSGTVDVTSFINLTSFNAYASSTGNDLEGFVISEANDKLKIIRVLYNKLTGSIIQYMPINVKNILMQSNLLDTPITDLSIFTQLRIIATSNNPNMGGNIPTLPSNIIEVDFGNSGLTGDIPPLNAYTNLVKLWVYINPNLTIPSNWTAPVTLKNIFFQSCNLETTEVDIILAKINSLGTSSGVLNLAGDNAPPTGGNSNSDKLALDARSWSVTIS